MAKTGRKGYGEELQILRRYSDLSEPYFRELKNLIESDIKEDRKFAIQQLTGSFQKMIPQDVNQEGEIKISIAKEISDKNETDPTTSDNSKG